MSRPDDVQAAIEYADNAESLMNKRFAHQQVVVLARYVKELEAENCKSTCLNCGLPLTKNPHPDAGKPKRVCEIGAMTGCLPCAENRAWKRGRLLHAILDAFAPVADWYMPEGGHRNEKELPQAVSDAVADLQADRKQALRVKKLEHQLAAAEKVVKSESISEFRESRKSYLEKYPSNTT